MGNLKIHYIINNRIFQENILLIIKQYSNKKIIIYTKTQQNLNLIGIFFPK